MDAYLFVSLFVCFAFCVSVVAVGFCFVFVLHGSFVFTTTFPMCCILAIPTIAYLQQLFL